MFTTSISLNWIFVNVALSWAMVSSGERITCNQAVDKCRANSYCSSTWYSKFQKCLFPLSQDYCSGCQEAIMHLFNIESGVDTDVMRHLLTCECEEGVGCEEHRKEIEQCLGHELSYVLAGKRPINCRLANARCQGNNECDKLREQFIECHHEDKKSKEFCARELLQHREAEMMSDCVAYNESHWKNVV